jgi:hypothetical protein
LSEIIGAEFIEIVIEWLNIPIWVDR